jgi:hypothetical protein
MQPAMALATMHGCHPSLENGLGKLTAPACGMVNTWPIQPLRRH